MGRGKFSWIGWAAGMAALASAQPSIAQQATPPTTNQGSPPPEAVGPSSLKDFTLNGTITKRADPTPQPTAPATQKAVTPATKPSATTTKAERKSPSSKSPTPSEQANADVARTTPTAPLGNLTSEPPRQGSLGDLIAQQPAPAPTASDDAVATPPEAAERFNWWWIAAGLGGAAALAFAFMLGRRRVFAGTLWSEGDLPVEEPIAPVQPRVAPAPPLPPARKAEAVAKTASPTTAPAPTPSAAAQSVVDLASIGIVSSNLRPQVELDFTPLGCIIEPTQVIIEFEIDLANPGSAPARDIVVEASLFNAGPNQVAQIDSFFDAPGTQSSGDLSLAPLQSMKLQHRVIAPRNAIQEYEVDGRKIFVPLVAFKTNYRWARGNGQTSKAYLVGRRSAGEKLAPLRLVRAGRILDLDARLLPGERSS